jgi:hypothetical protein
MFKRLSSIVALALLGMTTLSACGNAQPESDAGEAANSQVVEEKAPARLFELF